MENNERSPIIERLCRFIEFSGLSSSQFADKARIPRPSLSQMLHGRNKSLNNQILDKLNSAFPELNIVWLLFGSGDMLTNVNIETSERQTGLFEPNFIEEFPVNEDDSNSDVNVNFEEQSDKSVQNDVQATASAKIDSNSDVRSNAGEIPYVKNFTSREPLSSTSVPKNSAKKVTSIIVLYSDGSFETFTPAGEL